MASPADFAQASRLRNVTSIRTSGDHGYLVGPEILWAWFLHCNVMARALGLWPYKDVFHSAPTSDTRDVEALLSAMSAGPVGVGDRIGEADIDLIRRTCRADGVLVRPDVPIAAIDRAFFDAPVWSGELIVGSAHTQHAAGHWGYALTCNVGFDKERHGTRVARTDLGLDNPASDRVALFDWRTGSVEVLAVDGAYDVELESAGWDYRVLAPVLPGGIAVLGDPGLYASAGDARIAEVEADGSRVTLTVLGANERVRVGGWSERAISTSSWSTDTGGVDVAPTRDAATGAWEVVVEIGSAGWMKLHIDPR
jgi:hypothetical protein